MKRIGIFLAMAVGLFLPAYGHAQAAKSGVDKLYILDCGSGRAQDGSLRWTFGYNPRKAG